MKRKTVLALTFLMIASPLFAKEESIFTGIPEIKISEGGFSRTPENLVKERALGYKCTVTKMEDKYYWATRDNIELVPIASGAYITFLAINGSGYVRIVNPDMKEALKQVSLMAPDDPEGTFDYVEHLLLGLKSITYYGKSK